MLYIVTGLASFILVFFYDYFTLKNRSVLKKLFLSSGLLLLILSAVMVIITSDKIKFSIPVRVISGIFWLIFIYLLIYSVFLELPFNKTYLRESHSTELVDYGTYALCRHPGVLWFGISFFFAFFATGSILLIPAGILWTGADIISVYLQDRFFFSRMFPKYNEYAKSTPMLIPTARSIKKCISTIKIPGGRLYGKS